MNLLDNVHHQHQRPVVSVSFSEVRYLMITPSPGFHDYIPTVIYGLMRMEHWWNGTDTDKLKYLQQYLSHYHFIRHKFDMVWPGIECKFQRREA
jgi:hypothetical protein